MDESCIKHAIIAYVAPNQQASENARHIIRVDFVTWARSYYNIKFILIPCNRTGKNVQEIVFLVARVEATRKLEHDNNM